MDTNLVIYLGKHTLETALLLAAPILLVCMFSGLIVSLFQTVTSLRDMTLTIVPKLLAVGITALIFGNWTWGRLTVLCYNMGLKKLRWELVPSIENSISVA